MEEDTDIPKLVLGGTLTYDDAVKITHRACVKKEEISIYKCIYEAGVPIVSMYTTNDAEVNVMDLLKGE